MQNQVFFSQLLAFCLSSDFSSKKIDALFVHGNVDLTFEILKEALRLHRSNPQAWIILNGESHKDCKEKKINYGGWELWEDTLLKDEVPRDLILKTSQGRHTYEEASSLVPILKEKKVKTLGILALPYHIERCLLTHLASHESFGHSCNLVPYTLKNVNWTDKVTKQLLGSDQVLQCTRLEMLEEEYNRILKYQAQGHCASWDKLSSYFFNLKS